MDKELLLEVLQEALSHGGDYADIFVERKRTTGIGCEAGRIERVHTGLDIGIGIRVLFGDATTYGYTNDLSRESLLKAARVVSRAVKDAKTGQVGVELDLRTVQPRFNFEIVKYPEKISSEEKVDLVRRVEKVVRSVNKDKIKQVIVGYGDTTQDVIVVNSEGDYVEDERIRTRLVVHAVASEGGVIQTGYEAAGSFCGFELFERINPFQMAEEAGERAVQMLKAGPAPSGKMPVVLAGEAGGTMIHEACGHGLEADLVQKGLSVYAGKRGEKVAAESVTVIDDATLGDRYGSYRFDDEGVPSRKCVLIKNGVLVDYMYDRLTARKEGKESNGHGRRESYQHKPIPRMGNTYVAPGNANPEDIIKECREGLLVKKMGGGQVNTTTGDFVFDVAEGYLIKNGKVGPMVRGATLTGNGPEVLRVVDMIGSDLKFTIGTCGKDGQGVPVSDAQPTLLISELVVGGTGGK